MTFRRAAGNAILLCVAGFVALAALAMAEYPGGSWLDLHAHRHDLWRNFLCDLLGPLAINGQPNAVSSVAMMSAMLVMAVGLGISWWTLPMLSGRFSRWLRACGMVSMVGLVAVPLTPPTLSYQLHATAAFVGGLPAIAAWTLAVVGLALNPQTRRLAGLGGVALASVIVALGLYALQVSSQSGATFYLPVSHRIATVMFIAWLTAVGWSLRSTANAPAG